MVVSGADFSYCCFLRCMISLLRNSLYFASLRIGCSLSRFIRSSMIWRLHPRSWHASFAFTILCCTRGRIDDPEQTEWKWNLIGGNSLRWENCFCGVVQKTVDGWNAGWEECQFAQLTAYQEKEGEVAKLWELNVKLKSMWIQFETRPRLFDFSRPLISLVKSTLFLELGAPKRSLKAG